jgi:hypothetical protein
MLNPVTVATNAEVLERFRSVVKVRFGGLPVELARALVNANAEHVAACTRIQPR